MKSQPLVSVVTPFHNTAPYLAQCIESVLCQTYQNWEYVLVNNCSTDGSTEIAQRYASRLPERIRVIHTETFLSQTQNYNFALTCISPVSKYCKIVQADDWIFPECLNSMAEVAEVYPSLGIIAAYELEGDRVRLDGLPYTSRVVSGRDACRLYFLRDKYLFGSPTSVLMRSDVVRSRKPFYEERWWPFEDAHACFDLLRTWDFGFVHQVLTYTRRDNASIITPMLAFNVPLLARLTFVVAHGRDYLSQEEYEHYRKRAERDYYLFLTKAACAFRRESAEFWNCHRNGLAAISYSADWRRLARWLPRAIVEKVWRALWRLWDNDFPPYLASGRVLQGSRTTGSEEKVLTLR
jgi:glycosyltransferase involved in cell wall biosynthesis